MGCLFLLQMGSEGVGWIELIVAGICRLVSDEYHEQCNAMMAQTSKFWIRVVIDHIKYSVSDACLS